MWILRFSMFQVHCPLVRGSNEYYRLNTASRDFNFPWLGYLSGEYCRLIQWLVTPKKQVAKKESFESNLSTASNPYDSKFQGTKNSGDAIRYASGTSQSAIEKALKKGSQGKNS
ncbi:hypothetical protein ACMFMG_006563 [Clarireedia jacksonii]